MLGAGRDSVAQSGARSANKVTVNRDLMGGRKPYVSLGKVSQEIGTASAKVLIGKGECLKNGKEANMTRAY